MLNERNLFKKEDTPQNIVPGYNSLFDKMVTGFGQEELVKEEFKNAMRIVHDAWTLTDLYEGLKKIIYSLPETDNEEEMKKILFKLWNAIDTINVESNTKATETAYATLSNHGMQRFNSILGESK